MRVTRMWQGRTVVMALSCALVLLVLAARVSGAQEEVRQAVSTEDAADELLVTCESEGVSSRTVTTVRDGVEAASGYSSSPRRRTGEIWPTSGRSWPVTRG